MPSIAFDIEWRAVVPSTMDVAAAEAAQGAAEGRTIVADEQTDGRGRRGRAWASPAGAGLYCSVILRPTASAAASGILSVLTLAAGVGVREGIRAATGLAADLKWPNDLLVGRRKLAGILAEGVALGSATPVVIVGIGINVLSAAYPPDLASVATSVQEELGRPVDRTLVLQEVLAGLGSAYGDLREGRADDILRRWRDAAPSASGATVEWDTPDGTRVGETAGIDDAGALLVRTPSGTERVIAGEVRWRGLQP